jgi:hypothetical protein
MRNHVGFPSTFSLSRICDFRPRLIHAFQVSSATARVTVSVFGIRQSTTDLEKTPKA